MPLLRGLFNGQSSGARLHPHTTSFYVRIESSKVTLVPFFWSSSIGFILIVSFSDVIKTAVLRCNLQTIQVTYLKCAIQWLLVYSQSCAAITTVVIPLRNSIPLSCHPAVSVLGNQCSVFCLHIFVLDTSYKWNDNM